MNYAPVIIPTLSRFEQLKNCITSLKENTYAINTDLFIGLDFPPSASYHKGYNQIKEYLSNGIDGFAHVHVIIHQQNVGWYENYNILRQKAYEKYDCFIYTEDDNIFSPNFLEYMNKNLDKYQNDESVLAISGYAYPIDWNTDADTTQKINTYFSAWGYGIWKKKEEEMFRFITMQNFDKMMKNTSFMHKLCNIAPNQYCNFIKGMTGYTDMLIKDGTLITVDLSYGLYMFYTNKYMIFPTISKSRNMGHTMEGMNCKNIAYNEKLGINHRNYIYAEQPIDYQKHYELSSTVSLIADKKIHTNLDGFFHVSKKELFRCKCVWLIYKVLGRIKTSKLIKQIS